MFSSKQQGYIVAGKQKRHALIRATKDAAERAVKTNEIRGDFRIDTILMGSTGIGKTHWTKKSLDEIGIPYRMVRGSNTFFQFAGDLMIEHYGFTNRKNKQPNEKLVIFVDDCDSLFKDKEGRNALKSMSEKAGNRVLQYNKVIQEFMLTPLQLEILDKYRYKNGSQGFEVDCNEMIFIFATNFALPSENYANNYIKDNGPTDRANRLMDLAAIRRRFTCKDFVLDKESNWGWLSEVTLNDGLVDDILIGSSSKYQKEEILTWVWNNWDYMTEHNLDTIKDLAYRIKEYPTNYVDSWEADYIDADLMVKS